MVEEAKAACSGRKAGRPRGPHSEAAIGAQAEGLNQFDQQHLPSYSSRKVYYNCNCGQPKHVVFVGVRTANLSPTALDCCVCLEKGSSWEKLLYKLCDEEPLIQQYCCEGCSLPLPVRVEVCEGDSICVNRKPWDVTVPVVDKPYGLLIEVQGQGHNKRPMSKAHNSDSSLAARWLKDHACKDVALPQGWSVLWLVGNEDVKSKHIVRARWAAKLREAMAHVKAGGDTQLFTA